MNLESLDARIAARAAAAPEESYTAKLLQAGIAKCAKKLGEEAVELAIAAMDGDKREVAAEAADLLYHFLVLLKAADVPLDEVMAELERRTAQSGIEEKASRKTLS
jgi:phosphoribosyl-ATP pyrophosphohydrolase